MMIFFIITDNDLDIPILTLEIPATSCTIFPDLHKNNPLIFLSKTMCYILNWLSERRMHWCFRLSAKEKI